MMRFAAWVIVALVLATQPAAALPLQKKILGHGYCPLVLASKRMQFAQAPCRQTGGTRAAPICGGACDYTVCNVLRDAQNRPYCGCG